MRRIQRDLDALKTDGPGEKIWVKIPNEDDMSTIYVMLMASAGQYNGGLFFFKLNPFGTNTCYKDARTYPAHPPKLTNIMPWTGKIHPNIFTEFVCMSILDSHGPNGDTYGSFEGRGWTPMMTFMTIFISIHSMLGDEHAGESSGKQCLGDTIIKSIMPILTNESTDAPCQYFREQIANIWESHKSRYIEMLETRGETELFEKLRPYI